MFHRVISRSYVIDVPQSGDVSRDRFSHKWFVNMESFKRREENQLDATECFIALIICSACFGHLYAHHQELEAILVLLPYMVCNVLVVGGRLLRAEQQAMRPG